MNLSPIKLAVVLGFVFFLLATNRWMSFESGKEFFQAHDVDSYVTIARAAPAFPTKLVPFQHAQRFVLHYLIGLFAKATHIELSTVYFGVTGLFILLILLVALIMLADMGLSLPSFTFLSGLLILSPYTFRYYLIVPGMISDLFFVFTVGLCLIGMMRKNFLILCLGALLAMIARQTAVFLLPGICFWIYFSKLPHRLLKVFSLLILEGAIYFLIAHFIRGFVEPLTPVSLLLAGLPLWFQPEQYVVLGEHISRIFIPFLLLLAPLCVLVFRLKETNFGFNKWRPDLWASLILFIFVILQPFVGSPNIVGKNASRLAALGFLPVWFLLAFLLREFEKTTKTLPSRGGGLFFVLGVLLVSSLHHMYSAFGPSTAFQFALVQVFMAIALGAVFPFFLAGNRDL